MRSEAECDEKVYSAHAAKGCFAESLPVLFLTIFQSVNPEMTAELPIAFIIRTKMVARAFANKYWYRAQRNCPQWTNRQGNVRLVADLHDRPCAGLVFSNGLYSHHCCINSELNSVTAARPRRHVMSEKGRLRARPWRNTQEPACKSAMAENSMGQP